MSRKIIAFDSDGTVMDTMTIKHERCFAPAFLEVFDIEEGKDDIYAHWLDVNLYQKTRGINRFEGLVEILHYARDKYGYRVDGFSSLEDWVLNTPAYSVALLENRLKEEGSNTCIELALKWSKLVNEKIADLPPAKPFAEVLPTIKALHEDFMLVGVSSANRQAVDEEWTRNGLKPLFSGIYCQDEGSKSAILKKVKEQNPGSEVLMVGDAPKDLEEAKKASCLFYPIIPKAENASFILLKEKAACFLNGTYAGQDEEGLIKAFLASLGE